MSRRGLALVALLTIGCGQAVQIGSQGDPPPSTIPTASPKPPPPFDLCIKAGCGDSCPLTTCSGMDCPPSVGGFCDLDGVCTIDKPVCPVPDSRCAGVPCSEPCAPCDPASPNCSTDAGPADPPMRCDAFHQCQPGNFSCF